MLNKESILTFTLASLLAFLTLYAHAGSNKQLSIDNLKKHYGTPKVEINLGPDMLKLAGMVTQHSDPKAQQIIASIDTVSVRVFNVNEKPEKALKHIEKLSKDVNKEAWLPIVSINEENEKVRIFTKLKQDNIEGLIVLAVNSSEAVIINVVGDISPQDLAHVAGPLQLSQFIPK